MATKVIRPDTLEWRELKNRLILTFKVELCSHNFNLKAGIVKIKGTTIDLIVSFL